MPAEMVQQNHSGSHFAQRFHAQQGDRVRHRMDLASAAIVEGGIRASEDPKRQAVILEDYIGNVLNRSLFVDLQQHLFDGTG